MASLADLEHTPRPPIDTRKARERVARLDKTIASLAQLLPRMDEGSSLAYDEDGNLVGGYDPASQAEKTVGWLMPTGTLAEAAQGAKNIGNGALQAIGVWHGSPHKFDKFSLSKIGTGEGAQAYGHGLYFAESPGVAKQYAETLSNDGVPESAVINSALGYLEDEGLKKAQPSNDAIKNIFEIAADEWMRKHRRFSDVNNQGFKWTTDNSYVLQNAAQDNNLLDKLAGILAERNGFQSQLEAARTAGLKRADRMPLAQQADAKQAEFDAALRDGLLGHINRGNLYKTSLEWPDPARESADPLGPQHFLDWDKPLSEQPEMARKLEDWRFDPSLTGGDVYDRLTHRLGRPGKVSEDLWMFDKIPGIRYLDGGSRGAGSGTSNYVVFDDSLAKILERNGRSLADYR